MDIGCCEKIEEVMTAEGEKDAAINKTTFSKLNSITLWKLPNLKSFYSGNNTLQCPSLTTINIQRCLKMETFLLNKDISLHSTTFFSEKSCNRDLRSSFKYKAGQKNYMAYVIHDHLCFKIENSIGNFEDVLGLFEKTRKENIELKVVIWSAVISSYVQRVRSLGCVDGDDLEDDLMVTNALIDMYSNCKNVNVAHAMFDAIARNDRNVLRNQYESAFLPNDRLWHARAKSWCPMVCSIMLAATFLFAGISFDKKKFADDFSRFQDRECFACAPTGSGKTLAFLCPMLMKLKHASKDGIRAVIMCPTQELAVQTTRECKNLAEGTKFRIKLMKKELMRGADLSKFSCDVLISTPLRLQLAIRKKKMDLSRVEYLVLDEADKLFEVGSLLKQIDPVVKACSNPSIIRSLFSATLPDFVEELARSIMHDAVRVIIGRKNTASELIKQKLIFAGSEEGKLLALRQSFAENPLFDAVYASSRLKFCFYSSLRELLIWNLKFLLKPFRKLYMVGGTIVFCIGWNLIFPFENK
ncbi:hypothetical protein Q3G72_017297 [Acer saccharum]|nr:hypothetical protein Q3G72_017297 [Acer saccharum]